MTPAERAESEARRKLIAQQSREANPGHLRRNRVIAPTTLQEDLAGLIGFGAADDDRPVDWAALTRG